MKWDKLVKIVCRCWTLLFAFFLLNLKGELFIFLSGRKINYWFKNTEKQNLTNGDFNVSFFVGMPVEFFSWDLIDLLSWVEGGVWLQYLCPRAIREDNPAVLRICCCENDHLSSSTQTLTAFIWSAGFLLCGWSYPRGRYHLLTGRSIRLDWKEAGSAAVVPVRPGGVFPKHRVRLWVCVQCSCLSDFAILSKPSEFYCGGLLCACSSRKA